MENILRTEIKQQGQLYTITLYTEDFLTEFSTELGQLPKEIKELKRKAIDYVKKKHPGLKAVTASVVSGAIIITAIPAKPARAHEVNFNMTYLYFGSSSSYLRNITPIQENLNMVSPSYFDINADGSLRLTQALDPAFIKEVQGRGLKVVPFLSNHWDRNVGRAALQNRELLSTQIANAILKYNLDGVQIDIENVTDVDRDNYTDLVRLINEKVPEGKEVSVAVAANPNGWTKGWHGSYDYKALNQHADYLMIMAYDESYQGGPAGPVASYPWVERSIQFALKQGVPPENIVLGLPYYGRYWVEGQSSGGIGISAFRVTELVNKYNGTVTFDEASKSAKAVITIKPTDPSTVIAGKTFGPGTYTIWYENDKTIKAKFDLVHKYNLKGTGSWSLGQEDTSIWTDFKQWSMTHNGVKQGGTTATSEGTPEATPPPEEPTTPTPTVYNQAVAKLWNNSLNIQYQVNNSSKETINIYRFGKLHKTLQQGSTKTNGSKSVNWDLRGEPYGSYRVEVVSTASDGSTFSSNSYFQYQPIALKGESLYTVNQGESLAQIAKKFNVSENAIKVRNKFTPTDWVFANQVLIIPSKSGSPAVQGPYLNRLATERLEIMFENFQPIYETVQVYRYGNLYQTIILNSYTKNSRINRSFDFRAAPYGEYTVVVSAKNYFGTTRVLEHFNYLPVLAEGEQMYTAVSGDTLDRVATKTGVSKQQIIERNKLQKHNSLYVGQKIAIPR